MDRMKAVFFEEANELLQNLETSLLSLESRPHDKTLVEEVFRSMHTLKGNSSMFGFGNIVELVHELETIYDKLREGELQVTAELLDCSLNSVDHLNKAIKDPELADADLSSNHHRLISVLKGFLGTESSVGAVILEDESNEEETYYIRFSPNLDLLKDGTNPLYLIDELNAMGKSVVFPHFKKIEFIQDLDPTLCYTEWEVVLATESSKNEIHDVFVFVEGESEIVVEHLGKGNLIDSQVVNQMVENKDKFQEELIDIEAIKNYASMGNSSENNQAVEQSSKSNHQPTKKAESNVKKEKNVPSIRVSADKLDDLLSIVSELVTTQAGLSLHSENNYHPDLESISENVEKLSRQLRDVAFGMTLIPIKNIVGRFQRLVRDVSSSLGKKVNFVVEGDETELDKSIIESLTDPLMHILRNSLDHGIESEEDRVKNGKPKEGKILFKAFYSGTNVNIQITDDGKGLDVEAIRNKAIGKGIIAEDAVMSDKEIYELIFAPGFSTASVVTEVSGRGVGMDVVKKNISALRGEILVDSTFGKGTVITIKLPLTLSIIDGLLVKIANDFFIIPLTVVDKCYEIKYGDMKENFNKLLVLDEQQVPYINLREEFRVYEELPEISQLIVVENDGRRVGISVDNIVGEYQAVLKPLGKYYSQQDFVSGATILGDGSIALVLDTNKIINHFTVDLIEEE